jgi:hypothetical protein
MIHWEKDKQKTRPDRSGRAGIGSAAGRLLVPDALELPGLVELVSPVDHLVKQKNRQGVGGLHGHGVLPALVARLGDHVAKHDLAGLANKKLRHRLALLYVD